MVLQKQNIQKYLFFYMKNDFFMGINAFEVNGNNLKKERKIYELFLMKGS